MRAGTVLAAWLAASVPALASGEPSAGPSERIPLLLDACASCHGEGGNSVTENVPSIAGHPEYFIVDQLILMRGRVRPVAPMADLVSDLTDAEIEALAAHFSALEMERTGPPPDPELAAKGMELSEGLRCTSCHGPDLAGQKAIPRIAGQRRDYLFRALKAYRDGTRRAADTTMTAAVRGLSDADLTALAHYAASR